MGQENEKTAQLAAQTEQEQPDKAETNAVLDFLMSDSRKVLALVGAFVLFAGSYCNFWGTWSEELGRNSQGNLFTGFLWGGVFGKLCVAAGLAAAVLICLGAAACAWYGALVSLLAFVIQTGLVMFWGKTVVDGFQTKIYPGLGSFISFIGLAVLLVYSWRLYRVPADKPRHTKDKIR